MNKNNELKNLCRLIRYDIITSTTAAGSGHPTTALSAVELMTTLFFAGTPAGGFYHFDLKNPHSFANDRVIFSKGHASPLLYALYHAAGVISYKELMRLRKFNSILEGHPTPRFEYVDVATGSLGQGLSVGVGMALGIKLKSQIINPKSQINDKSKIQNYKNLGFKNSDLFGTWNLEFSASKQRLPKIFVLLGDSEMAEGQVWEAMEIASYYKLNNLIAIADVNRLGQSTQTMLGWDIKTYVKRAQAFGWETIVVKDGHNLKEVYQAFIKASQDELRDRPVIIIAKTIKGKGVSFLEDKEGWHGKPVPKDLLESALRELGKVDFNIRGKIKVPNLKFKIKNLELNKNLPAGRQGLKLKIKNYKLGDLIATRQAYGEALAAIGKVDEKIVVLDGETSNSTYAEKFAKKFPKRYFEMFIAEQNMVSTALGLSKQGFIPFASTFAAFLTRGFDQLRIAQYSVPNLKICGSHAGVSIGPDGPSQMGLEDIAMFRSILNSVVFYPSDAVSAFKLVQIMANNLGLFYMRTNRSVTPVIYDNQEEFKIGGCKIHKSKIPALPAGRQNPKSKIKNNKVLIIAAGITLHEALKAQKELAKENIETIVVDLYSVKPIDSQTICKLAKEIKNIIVVEDHYPYGGIGEEISTLIVNCKLKIENYLHLCVRKLPRSGTPEELLSFEEINAAAIIKKAKEIVK
jgi:transketolase